MRLKELPVDLDAANFAKGFLELFNEEESTVLRFGMLPAKKMELLERLLREKFEALGKPIREVFPAGMSALEDCTDDDRISSVGGEPREWNLKRLVSEAVHEISLELYRQGDLVA